MEFSNVHLAKPFLGPPFSKPTFKRGVFSLPSGNTVTQIILAVTVCSQLFLSYQFLQVRTELKRIPSQSQLTGVDERFSKISVVLRFLLDKEKGVEAREIQPIGGGSSESVPNESDLPVARVTADRLNLRVGPGINNAPLMTVSAGTLLVVEDESNGKWVRVVAPNGARVFALRDELEITRSRE